MKPDDLLEIRQQLMTNVGLAIVSCQMAEATMREVLAWTLPMELSGDVDKTHEIRGKVEQQPFGRLLAALKRYFHVDDAFIVLLDGFREKRNSLAHGLLDIP